MASLHEFSSDGLPRKSWSSGAGSSCELVLWPAGSTPGSADCILRASLETVDRTGALPTLGDHDHVIAGLGRTGLILDHGDDAHPTYLRPQETCSFRGDWATRVEGLEEPTDLLSICTRVGRARATLQTVTLGQRELRDSQTSSLGLLYISRGALTARATDEEQPLELYAGEGVFVSDGRAGDEWALSGTTPDAEFLWAQIELF